ncbi:MAG: maleylpyruvate isomerase family mycothiol-dependent enzyme [Geodermatophilaceae bacterium]|nr:maleylpyruvate isomerase family mycothiol-dependent enzyme [Geodermatophilaceae bacterium]
MAASYEAVRLALEAQWSRLIDAFAEAAPLAPSRLPGWSVADLERHIAQTSESLGRLAAGPPAAGPVSGFTEWAAALADTNAQLPRGAPPESTPVLAEVMPTTLEALAAARPKHPVRQLTGTHHLADAALFRLVEAVVHGMDLPDPPGPDRQAQGIVVRALAYHLATLAPGRSVELRISPDAAVQLIEGPRHTRGTPPGVVEIDPTSFLRLATGRMTWTEAVDSGRLRASGERTDLSAYLPLLR